MASAAAVIGRSFDFDLLTAVTDAGPDEVAGALRELQEAYFVLPGADAVTFDFRHALIRDALYADTDLPVRRRLHERVARAAAERGYRGAFISAHFEQAGWPGPAYEHAVAAAREAASMSAHSEALELCRRAVRNLPAQLPALDQAGLFAALGDEAAATDDNTAAAEAYQTAHELNSAAGEVRAAAALVPAHGRGRAPARRWSRCPHRHAAAALDSLDAVADADRERARLHSAMAAAYLVDDRLDEAIIHGERGRAESQRIGDDEAALNAATTLGSVLVFAGRMDEGWQLLEEAIAGAGRTLPGGGGGPRIPDGRIVCVRADGIRPRRALAHRGRPLRGEGGAMESPALHGVAPRACPVGDRPVGCGRADRDRAPWQTDAAASPPRSPRSTSWATSRWAAVTGTPPASCCARRSPPGERMAELQRLSPPLWGLAEAARCQGDYDTALTQVRARLPGLGRGHGRRLPVPLPDHRRTCVPGTRRH